MTNENDVDEQFVLDGRSLAQRLDALRDYGQKVAMGPEGMTWAKMMFGKEAGGDDVSAWAPVRQRCMDWYHDPERADGTLAPEQAFLLALLGILEGPNQAFNRFAPRYRDLYYRGLLGLAPERARADQLVVQWSLVDTLKEQAITSGQLLEAGQDSLGQTLRYRVDRPVVVNHARWTDLCWCVPDGTRLGGRRARVVFDGAMSVPEQGLRLGAPASGLTDGLPTTTVDRDVIGTRVIGSPLFKAASGQRLWRLTFVDVVPLLEAAISVENVWQPMSATSPDSKVWTLGLANDVVVPTLPTDLEGLQADTPLVRLRRADGGPIACVTELSLEVIGSTNVRCVTDEGDEIQAGLPFGEMAAAGNGISLISEEWVRFASLLETVTITPVWAGLPTVPFEAWYKGYQINEQFSEDTHLFTGTALKAEDYEYSVGIDWMAKGKLVDSNAVPLELFDTDPNKAPTGKPLDVGLPIYAPEVISAIPESSEVLDWPLYIRMYLCYSFHAELYQQHLKLLPGYQTKTEDVKSEATSTVGNQVHKVTQTIPMTTKVVVTPPVWNPPYIPHWQSVRMGYKASEKTVGYQLVSTPFGWADEDQAYRGPTMDVYLGVDGIEPAQLLSLYWLLKSPGKMNGIAWEYLARGERWAKLGHELSDETDSWANSGLWTLRWPGDALHEAKGMPAGRYWLRARVTPDATPAHDGVPVLPRLMGLATNVSAATLVDADRVAADHLMSPLAAGSVTHAVNGPEGIQQVIQPWASVGGSPPESRQAFNARVAARLRHRGRALDTWDLVKLLREHDAGIREVSVWAQPRRDNNNEDYGRDGTLPQVLVVMPTLLANDSENALMPVYSPARLRGLERWLQARTSPWLKVTCQNPSYRSVRVSWQIKYRAGVSQSYGDQLVRATLERVLRPWMGVESAPVSVIGKPLARRAIRECIMQVTEVEDLQRLLIDGDNGTRAIPGGKVKCFEVAVPEYVPLEYHNVAIKIVALTDPDGKVNVLDSKTNDRLVRLPQNKKVLLEVELDGNPQDIFLYNIDSGLPIPWGSLMTREAIGIFGERISTKAAFKVVQRPATLYEIAAEPWLKGICRIGVAWKVGQETLLSGRVGQWITLEIQAQTQANRQHIGFSMNNNRDMINE